MTPQGTQRPTGVKSEQASEQVVPREPLEARQLFRWPPTATIGAGLSFLPASRLSQTVDAGCGCQGTHLLFVRVPT